MIKFRKNNALVILIFTAATLLVDQSVAWQPQSDEPQTDVETSSQADVEEAASPSEETETAVEPAATPPEPEDDRTPPALQDTPYRICIEIGFAGSEMALPGIRETLVERIRAGFVRMFGPMWDLEVRHSVWLTPGTAGRLTRVPAEELMERYPATDFDKVLLITADGNAGGVQVTVREMDLRVQELSPVLSEHAADVNFVPGLACRLGRDAFRPYLMFVGRTVDDSEMEFAIQAGNLTPPDPTAVQLTEGDVLRPFLRQLERRDPNKVKLLQRLDLCYIRLTELNSVIGAADENETAADPVQVTGSDAAPVETIVDRGRVRGVLLSHGLVPYGGRARRSLQQVALRQRPASSASKVRLVLQNRPEQPLVCIRVDKVRKFLQTDTNTEPPVRIITDRSGEIQLEVDPENPTCWLYAYSGSILLARVPYAPGLIPYDTVKLPDDSIRLGVEGDLYLLRDQLVDMVAEKAVNMSLAKRAAEEREPEKLEEAVSAIDRLPGRDDFGVKLVEIRAPAVAKADATRNPYARRRVEKLIGAMSDSLDKFFDQEKRMKEAKEINQLRKQAGLPPAAPSPTGGQ